MAVAAMASCSKDELPGLYDSAHELTYHTYYRSREWIDGSALTSDQMIYRWLGFKEDGTGHLTESLFKRQDNGVMKSIYAFTWNTTWYKTGNGLYITSRDGDAAQCNSLWPMVLNMESDILLSGDLQLRLYKLGMNATGDIYELLDIENGTVPAHFDFYYEWHLWYQVNKAGPGHGKYSVIVALSTAGDIIEGPYLCPIYCKDGIHEFCSHDPDDKWERYRSGNYRGWDE